MTEKVDILSVSQYFDKYAVNGIAKGLNRLAVKQQIVEDFRKEIYGLVEMRSKKHFRGKIPEEGNQEALDIARSVIKEEFKKYKALIKLFEKYRETSGLLSPEDLTIDVEEKAEDDPDIPEDAVMTDPATMQAVPSEQSERDTMQAVPSEQSESELEGSTKVAEPVVSGYIQDIQITDGDCSTVSAGAY